MQINGNMLFKMVFGIAILIFMQYEFTTQEVLCDGLNEEYTTCRSICPEPTCASNHPWCFSLRCGGEGCRCKQNHVRNADRQCVLREEC